MAARPTTSSKLALPGTYVFRFNGFDREDTRARNLVGLGRLTLTAGGAITNGRQFATNSPISGQVTGNQRLRHSLYDLSGSYSVVEAGPPLVVSLDVAFTKAGGGHPGDKPSMQDRFFLLQSGPDRFWVVSSNARDMSGARIDEMVMGEAVKVDPNTW